MELCCIIIWKAFFLFLVIMAYSVWFQITIGSSFKKKCHCKKDSTFTSHSGSNRLHTWHKRGIIITKKMAAVWWTNFCQCSFGDLEIFILMTLVLTGWQILRFRMQIKTFIPLFPQSLVGFFPFSSGGKKWIKLHWKE